ncbi:Uncharacterized membrane protein YcaP, DUF421 family [Halobacillus dabanensis]|uniref:Uncharacterized membrane protein YcaP, DUF421 family n=1 Tax=Halobacillus dabanensis TaxID=240302 RepID=A0A1I3Z9D3_HALDA|nr:DUF421 domain-containing protein [Halobacillus dabanensis]SFK40281.1 Uncharacterized membrane protein YcaP, DUF421 family [Halobacillus dabanensis]
MSIAELIIRLVIAFITLLALTRLMGRKEISQMTFFNFVSGIAIGTIGAFLAIDSTLSIRNGVLALIAWSTFTIALGIIDIKSKAIRKVIEGEPRIVIKKGKVMEDELRKVRLDIDALNAKLREKNVFSIADVDYAIFETDGKLSVMKKEIQQTVTRSDLNIQQQHTNVFPTSTLVVSDGQIDKANLEKLNLNEQWLNQQLESAGITSISDVFYA